MTVSACHSLHPGEGSSIFIAAGVLKEPEHLTLFLQAEDPLSVPLLTLGSFTLSSWVGNASTEGSVDFAYYPDVGMAGNARGLPNGGVEGMRRLKEQIRRLTECAIKTNVSVTNLPHENPMDVMPALVEEVVALQPTAIEINLSCPNGKKADGSLHLPICSDADASGEVVQACREIVGADVCLGVKDSPHVASLDDSVDVQEVSRLVEVLNPLIDFITGINTIGNQPFPDINATKGRGGMSGPVVANIARQWLAATYASADNDVAILSCGGVETSNAPTEIPLRRQLGALLVGGAQEFYRAESPLAVVRQWRRGQV